VSDPVAAEASSGLRQRLRRWRHGAADLWRLHRALLGLGLASLLMLVALWNPGWPGRSRTVNLLVVLDITQSMAVKDRWQTDAQGARRAVTRLAHAKQQLDASLAALPCGSRVGLGVFTSYRSFVLMNPVEVCQNYAELRGALADIDFRMAWSGNSEVAKGLYAGLRAADEIPGRPALVFVTDGHESPPVNPRFRPPFKGTSAPVAGVILGVGGDEAVAIPKLDAQGRAVGLWRAGEVMQVDPRSQGRSGTSQTEALVDDEAPPVTQAMLGATPGREHLSAQRADYLQLLAEETGLGFARLEGVEGLARTLRDARLAHAEQGRVDTRGAASLLALLVLVAVYLPAWRWRLRRAIGALGRRGRR
jgi:mxaL protein